MKVEQDKVVTLAYSLKDGDGKEWESSNGVEQPWVYLHGHGDLVPGLTEALTGKDVGEELTLELPSERAYGEYQEDLRQQVPVEAFAEIEGLHEGMRLAAQAEDGVHAVTVAEINSDHVVVDANHPLAGKDVHIWVKVIDVRDATAEEIDHGHVHGPDGHHH